MTIVPTANVYVSFTRAPMLQFLKGSQLAVHRVAGMTIEEFNEAGVPQVEDIFTFSNSNLEDEGSLQITDFSHEIGYEGGNTMNLTIVDPKREFEKRIFAGGLASELAAYGIDFPGFNSYDAADPDQQHKYLYLMNIPEGVKEALAPEFKILKEAKQKPSKTIYVIYGVGKDPNTWSGPHKMTIVNAMLEAKDVRKLKLRLVGVPQTVIPTHNKTSYGTLMKLPSDTNAVVNGYSRKFTHLRMKGSKFVGGGHAAGMPESYLEEVSLARHPSLFYGDLGDREGGEWREDLFMDISESHPHLGGQVKQFVDSIDIHRVITDTVKDLVQKATGNPNVVVLFPNLNIILAPLIEKNLKEFEWDLADWPSDGNQFFQNTLKVMRGILEAVGLSFKLTPDLTGGEPYPIIAMGNILRWMKTPVSSEWAVLYAGMEAGLSEETKDSAGVYTNVFDKLKEFFNELNKYGKAIYSANYNIITESTTEKIAMWQQIQQESNQSPANSPGEDYSPVAATFDTLLHEKALDNAVTIVGSMSMITQFLYGQKRLSLKLKEQIIDEYMSDDFNNLMLGFAHYPLHKSDYLLGVPENNEMIRSQTMSRHKKMMENNAGFAGMFEAPDYFAFSDEEPGRGALNRIKEEGIPIFKYNTQSPNITKLTANYNPGYWASLQKMQPIKKLNLFSSAEDLKGEMLASFSEPSVARIQTREKVAQISQGAGDASIMEAIVAGLTEEAKNSDIGAAFRSPEMGHDFKLLMAQQIDNLNNPLFVTMWVNQIASLHEDSVTAQGDVAMSLSRMVNQVSVTTLPMFAYSDASFLFKEAILLAQFPNIRQTTTIEDSPLDTFLSGVYRLSGFKHTISPKKVESHFKMVKNSI